MPRIVLGLLAEAVKGELGGPGCSSGGDGVDCDTRDTVAGARVSDADAGGILRVPNDNTCIGVEFAGVPVGVVVSLPAGTSAATSWR